MQRAGKGGIHAWQWVAPHTGDHAWQWQARKAIEAAPLPKDQPVQKVEIIYHSHLNICICRCAVIESGCVRCIVGASGLHL